MSFFSRKFIISSFTCSRLRMITIALPSPFVFSSALLSSSPALNSQPNHNNAMSDFLLNECGFCSSELAIVLRRRATMSRAKSVSTAKEAVQFLRDSGLSQYWLKKTIVRCPFILALKVDGQLKPKLEFLKTIGFADQELTNLICRAPRLLTYSLEDNIRPRISYFESLFGSKATVAKALRRVPGLMDCSIENHLLPKVEYVKNNMGILEGCKKLICALKAVIPLGPENLERKMKYFASLGLAEEEIHQMLSRFPTVLNISMNKMQENMHFFIRTAGLTPNFIALNPMLLTFSLEKRLKPRYEVFKSASAKPHYKPLPSLASTFRISERLFIQKFGQQ